MDIKDAAFLAIVDSAKNILLSYSCEEFDRHGLLSSLGEENGQVFIFKDHTVFVSRINDISVLLVTFPESNEIFVSKAFEALVNSLSRVIKNWCIERIAEKYDQLQLIFHEFVFKGIILVDEEDELSSRIMKRTFENMNAIKVNKGFASLLNKATKSLRK
ncbi:uncharacterized protein VICG_00120 [Vittaforma corneae ATCC 50505]|uniref:Coatomer subunit zeta n=1 Tax=Vittaforma corneae (strain ATCC 50505) TaxID=993615 RepID=L2GQL0_VITCO|nr:uncharacterized protein VICG_00120 [Vittaforma corneae ATCC 50505]ELA42805.1 hypothetical protein VICG_00120 [Vittaforma corneae ATCC 50505]